jgi:hypothetical protein
MPELSEVLIPIALIKLWLRLKVNCWLFGLKIRYSIVTGLPSPLFMSCTCSFISFICITNFLISSYNLGVCTKILGELHFQRNFYILKKETVEHVEAPISTALYIATFPNIIVSPFAIKTSTPTHLLRSFCLFYRFWFATSVTCVKQHSSICLIFSAFRQSEVFQSKQRTCITCRSVFFSP